MIVIVQGNNQEHASSKGTGLGLPICNQLVTAMKGTIGLHDRCLDNGQLVTVFWVEIPFTEVLLAAVVVPCCNRSPLATVRPLTRWSRVVQVRSGPSTETALVEGIVSSDSGDSSCCISSPHLAAYCSSSSTVSTSPLAQLSNTKVMVQPGTVLPLLESATTSSSAAAAAPEAESEAEAAEPEAPVELKNSAAIDSLEGALRSRPRPHPRRQLGRSPPPALGPGLVTPSASARPLSRKPLGLHVRNVH